MHKAHLNFKEYMFGLAITYNSIAISMLLHSNQSFEDVIIARHFATAVRFALLSMQRCRSYDYPDGISLQCLAEMCDDTDSFLEQFDVKSEEFVLLEAMDELHANTIELVFFEREELVRVKDYVTDILKFIFNEFI